MISTRDYIERLFQSRSVTISAQRTKMFEEFVMSEQNVKRVETILQNQEIIMVDWEMRNRIEKIMDLNGQIANGTVGVPYKYKMDFMEQVGPDVAYSELDGLEEIGLAYNIDEKSISGIPTASGEFNIKLKFRVIGENDDSELHEKMIKWIVNPDPKSLWKDVPSSQDGVFPKTDNAADFQTLGNKHIVVSSKRGRSHANVGSFRDDDYAFKFYESTGWSAVAVSDGAGSSKFSRKGSSLACNEVISYLEKNLSLSTSEAFEQLLLAHKSENASTPIKSITEDEEKVVQTEDEIAQIKPLDEIASPVETPESTQVQISKFIYNLLGGCAKSVYNTLEDFAKRNELEIKDLHSTLIFMLCKKFDFGYVILTFSVGDCPIGVLNKDQTEVKLMNWLDVGEFSGGTRFITMPEIFTSEKFPSRFGFKIIEDFSYLMLMTDGIYDAKFEVEANLEKLERWNNFIADLGGHNADSQKVNFNVGNTNIAQELSSWMDFWSPGNHDDRTLAVIF